MESLNSNFSFFNKLSDVIDEKTDPSEYYSFQGFCNEAVSWILCGKVHLLHFIIVVVPLIIKSLNLFEFLILLRVEIISRSYHCY
jgi:hypothetical protein